MIKIVLRIQYTSPMRPIVLLLLLLSLMESAVAQIMSGVVLDSVTQASLPYVHVGVRGKNMGTISRDDGTFRINLAQASSRDSLTFSSVGYRTERIPRSEWSQSPLRIYLAPQTYTLQEVLVEDERIYEPVKLGRYQPTKITTGHSGVGDFGFGGEWGLRINHYGQTYRITDVGFHTRFNTLDSALFRINIYNIRDSLPHESLLARELLVKSYRRDKWVTKDVSAEKLVIDQDIIVSFEVLRLWRSRKGDNALFFTHGKSDNQSKTYRRPSSLASWRIQDGPPLTLHLTVVGYESSEE